MFRLCAGAAAILALATTAESKVQISSKATRNMTCSGGVCAPTAKNVVLNVDDLASLLASGDVKVVSDASAPDIELTAPLGWTSAHRLTLDARRAIAFAKPLTVGGNGALTIVTNDGGTNGDFSFAGKGRIQFANEGDSLIINGNSYVLAGSIAELAADIQGNLSGLYGLANSYDAAGDGTYTAAPLSSFSGTFEGLGNAISNFSLRLAAGNRDGGLFQCSCPSSVVRDITLGNASIQGSQSNDSLGALSGVNYGTIKGAWASGSVRGDAKHGANDEAGGLVGLNHGLIIDSHSRAKVSGAAVAGGLVGYLQPAGATPATISYSTASGNVSGQSEAGGLVGALDFTGNEEIDDSYASGTVASSEGGSLGGLVGAANGSIVRSFATGAVSAHGCVSCGGLAGTSGGTIVDSYAMGAVTIADCSACGGLVGTNSGTITTSYATGALNSTGGYLGGLIGEDSAPSGSLTDTYWDTTTSGITDSGQGAGNISDDPGIAGLTTAEFQAGLPSGFSSSVWGEASSINGGLPYLLANKPPAH
jgi:hypothetical protein